MKAIRTQIASLAIHHEIYRQLQSAVSKNKALHHSTYLFSFVFNSYAASALMSIRRQVSKDSRKQSISLRRLLEEVHKNPSILNRSNFRKLYKGSVVEGFADRDYDSALGETGLNYPRKDTVAEDLDLIIKMDATFKDYIDRELAHYDKRPPKKIPKWDDLERAVLVLVKITKKYAFIIEAIAPDEIIPDDKFFDISYFLQRPWIVKDD